MPILVNHIFELASSDPEENVCCVKLSLHLQDLFITCKYSEGELKLIYVIFG